MSKDLRKSHAYKESDKDLGVLVEADASSEGSRPLDEGCQRDESVSNSS